MKINDYDMTCKTAMNDYKIYYLSKLYHNKQEFIDISNLNT